MAGTSPQHEQVPDRMVVGELLPRVEDDTEHIHDSPGKEENKSATRYACHELFPGSDDEPPHQDVGGSGELGKTSDEDGTEHDPCDRQRPDSSEEEPGQRPRHPHYEERGIGPSDQEVDRAVIEYAEDELGLRRAQAVVESGGEVQQDKTRSIDTEARDLPGNSTALIGKDDEQDKTGYAEHSSNTMGHRVGDLLAQTIEL